MCPRLGRLPARVCPGLRGFLEYKTFLLTLGHLQANGDSWSLYSLLTALPLDLPAPLKFESHIPGCPTGEGRSLGETEIFFFSFFLSCSFPQQDIHLGHPGPQRSLPCPAQGFSHLFWPQPERKLVCYFHASSLRAGPQTGGPPWHLIRRLTWARSSQPAYEGHSAAQSPAPCFGIRVSLRW